MALDVLQITGEGNDGTDLYKPHSARTAEDSVCASRDVGPARLEYWLRDRLDVQQHEASAQVAELSAQLAKYDALGHPFAELAQQYGQIQQEIA